MKRGSLKCKTGIISNYFSMWKLANIRHSLGMSVKLGFEAL